MQTLIYAGAGFIAVGAVTVPAAAFAAVAWAVRKARGTLRAEMPTCMHGVPSPCGLCGSFGGPS